LTHSNSVSGSTGFLVSAAAKFYQETFLSLLVWYQLYIETLWLSSYQLWQMMCINKLALSCHRVFTFLRLHFLKYQCFMV